MGLRGEMGAQKLWNDEGKEREREPEESCGQGEEQGTLEMPGWDLRAGRGVLVVTQGDKRAKNSLREEGDPLSGTISRVRSTSRDGNTTSGGSWKTVWGMVMIYGKLSDPWKGSDPWKII